MAHHEGDRFQTNRFLFLCFGQSNMEGFPGLEEQDKAGVDNRFQVFATVEFPKLGRTKGNWGFGQSVCCTSAFLAGFYDRRSPMKTLPRQCHTRN
jgi:hypothetical protein